MDGTVDGVVMASVLYCQAVDSGRTEAASRWLDRMVMLLRATPVALRPLCLAEAAWFTAARRGFAVEARW